MDLKTLVNRLEEFAPLKAAVDWDNVGLMVEPTDPLTVHKILLTNDLTEPVLDEAINNKVNMIVCYHPTIGVSKYLKRLTQIEWKQRQIVKCIENRIALFTPHTTWDSIDGGINDFILKSFDAKKIESVRENPDLVNPCGYTKSIRLNATFGAVREKLIEIATKVGAEEKINMISEKEILIKGTKQSEIELLADAKGVVALIETIKSSFQDYTEVLSTIRIQDLDKPLMKNVGLGRIAWLNKPIKIRDVIERTKELVKMKTFRFAIGNGKTLDDTISTLAIGAGTSSGLLNDTRAEFIITGEITHHEILHEVHRGVSLIVTDHSNTERCYLEPFKSTFLDFLKRKYNESVEIIISKVDRDPLEYV